MSRNAVDRDIEATLTAAREWIDRCLVGDESIFTESRLWTAENIAAIRTSFVDHPDTSDTSFMDKFRKQLRRNSPFEKQFAAELLWALLLFPCNIRASTKRAQILEVWKLSGTSLSGSIPALSDAALAGIGSGGPGFNNFRPLELTFLIDLVASLKSLSKEARVKIFRDYEEFVRWISRVPQKGKRQYRHMLRFFAFPDRVERMSSNTDRKRVLEKIAGYSSDELGSWSDQQLDAAMLKVRQEHERKLPGKALDFYNPPLVTLWKDEPTVESTPEEVDAPSTVITVPGAADEQLPKNLIFYGPPGTGKTFTLLSHMRRYAEAPEHADRDAWNQQILTQYGWRPVIVAALAELGGEARVPQIRDHAWIQSKAKERGRTTNILPTMWNYLQEHEFDEHHSLGQKGTRPPFVFLRKKESRWSLVGEWEEIDEEAAALRKLMRAGPNKSQKSIERFRTVTFHPSFGYEEFVRGIRPVADESLGTSSFQVVDGVFKQVCDAARADPSHRYALFVDEINRGNIAKIFGELITLIEVDKRVRVDEKGERVKGLEIDLAGGQGSESSEKPFGVPWNLDIYGTMNTADRSIALLDIALRRRFEFIEMEPDYSLLDLNVGKIHLGSLLSRINDRLEYFLDRDRRIGHAYLMKVSSLNDLREVFDKQIIPLLQEYFFEDLARVAAVLSSSGGKSAFVKCEQLGYRNLFGSAPVDGAASHRERYRVTSADDWGEEDFAAIYANSQGIASDGSVV